jgi:hypothetical protein
LSKLAAIGTSLLLAMGVGACGSDKKAGTGAAPAGSGTPAPKTSVSGDASSEQRAETVGAVACLSRYAKKLKGARQYGQPAVAGLLPTRNVIVLVMYGPKGGARAGEEKILRAHPSYAAYNSPDDKILVFFARKVVPGSPDFKTGDMCQRAASAAG